MIKREELNVALETFNLLLVVSFSYFQLFSILSSVTNLKTCYHIFD